MATHIMAESELDAQTSSNKIPQLPVRELGLKYVPALPVDVVGMVDTLRKLSVKLEQRKQALQGLGKTFTLGGSTNRAYNFLYGAQGANAQAAAVNERLRKFLRDARSHNPLEILPRLMDKIKNQDNESVDDIAGNGGDLTTLAIEDPKQWSMGWTTFPDVYTLGLPHLNDWAATVDVRQPDKATEAFFPTIARYGTGFNLILPKKVRTPDVGVWRDLFGAEWTPKLDAAAKAGLLYVIDLRIYEPLRPQTVAGTPRFTPSTVTVLVQNAATKAMTPELIRVAGGNNKPRIFSRQGSSTTPSAWVYALQAAKVSVTVYGIWLGHVYEWHIVTAAMQMTMFEHVSANNPVHKLLGPQSNYLIPFDDVLVLGFNSLAEVPPTSIVTARQFLELLDLYGKSRLFFDDDPPTKLEKLGIAESDFTVKEPWDQYPVVGNLLAIWNATGRYVSTVVDRAYSTDGDVQRDREVQTWIAQSGKEHDGNIRGLPAVDSKDALTRVLHSVIHRITAHGSSRLYRSGNPALTFVANYPPTLQDATIPDPSASFDTAALHRFLPRTGTLGSMIHFYATFWASPTYEPLLPIEGIETDLFFDDAVSNKALIEFRRFIVEYVERLEPDMPQIWQWERNIEL